MNLLIEKTWQWLLITVGCVLAAGGYVVFILPMNMVEGGVTGLGIIARHLTGLPIVGLTSLVITAFVFIAATKILGKSFGAKSIYATILMNVLIDVFMLLEVSKITDDMLLGAFYGGAIVGLGLGLVYFAGASTGGSDALGQVLWTLKRIPIGSTLIAVDVVVLGVATFLFIPFEQIMYSMIFIFVEIKVIDMVLNGIRANQRVMIVTDMPDEIKKAIFDSLRRGLTIFTGTGGYTGHERYMLTSVVPKKNIPELRRIIAHVDENAFVIIQDIHQVYGEGFEKLPKSLKKNNSSKNEPAKSDELQDLEAQKA